MQKAVSSASPSALPSEKNLCPDGVITVNLLRRRAEHNDGELSTLKEITLHQFNLREISPVLGDRCRQLEILYLQNNLLERIENLSHLKDLRYLNMAVNLVRRIDGLESCEFLNKLDLTCNYVEDLESIKNLRHNMFLKHLYLIGNPVCQIPGYRHYVVALLPQLETLDGQEITRTERIRAMQELSEVNPSLAATCNEGELAEPKFGADGERLYSNTPEDRLAAHMELESKRKGVSPSVDPNKIGEVERIQRAVKLKANCDPVREIEKYGRVLQRNDGGWKYKFEVDSEDGGMLFLDVSVGKFLDTSLLDIHVEPTWIRITVKKEHELVLLLPEEVLSGEAKAKRSAATGNLQVAMPLLAKREPVGKQPAAAAAHADAQRRSALSTHKDSSGETPASSALSDEALAETASKYWPVQVQFLGRAGQLHSSASGRTGQPEADRSRKQKERAPIPVTDGHDDVPPLE